MAVGDRIATDHLPVCPPYMKKLSVMCLRMRDKQVCKDSIFRTNMSHMSAKLSCQTSKILMLLTGNTFCKGCYLVHNLIIFIKDAEN